MYTKLNYSWKLLQQSLIKGKLSKSAKMFALRSEQKVLSVMKLITVMQNVKLAYCKFH